jgi:hypothetical protein
MTYVRPGPNDHIIMTQDTIKQEIIAPAVPFPNKIRKLQAVERANVSWIVGDLYRAMSSMYSSRPISHLVYRITQIDSWEMMDHESINITLAPVLDVWSASVIENDPRGLVIQPEPGWTHVDAVTLGLARTRIDIIFNEELRRYEGFRLTSDNG